MASIGHVLVGLAIARAHDSSTNRSAPERSARVRFVGVVAFCQLALLPDLDVIAFRFGIPYSAEFGHRGASHSMLAAIVVGLLATPLLMRGLQSAMIPTAVAAICALASHGALDMLTDGGLGVAWWWPFETDRHFFPVRPLPVAPIGRAFVSSTGFKVALTEIAMFLPFGVYALWPRARRENRGR
jgi:inner membrane protein